MKFVTEYLQTQRYVGINFVFPRLGVAPHRNDRGRAIEAFCVEKDVARTNLKSRAGPGPFITRLDGRRHRPGIEPPVYKRATRRRLDGRAHIVLRFELVLDMAVNATDTRSQTQVIVKIEPRAGSE